MSALLLLQHGLSKFFAFPMAMKAPALFSLYWFAGAIELVFGTLLLIGLFSRCAAFILSGHLAFAYFMGHAPKGFFPLTNGGESAVLFCFVFLRRWLRRRRADQRRRDARQALRPQRFLRPEPDIFLRDCSGPALRPPADVPCRTSALAARIAGWAAAVLGNQCSGSLRISNAPGCGCSSVFILKRRGYYSR